MMPAYHYVCQKCDTSRVDMRCIAERHDGPDCDRCHIKMTLVVSPVRGIVKNPAVPKEAKS